MDIPNQFGIPKLKAYPEAVLDGLDEFTKAFIVCAFWTCTDESDPETGGEPLDENYSLYDIDEGSLGEMSNECQEFQEKMKEIIDLTGDKKRLSQAGHDFWLTKCRHGAGFWEGHPRWPDDIGQQLTELAHEFNECSELYVGDNGKIYYSK